VCRLHRGLEVCVDNDGNEIGYARLNENVTNGKADAHEGLDFYKPVDNPDKTKPVWGENQWPSVAGFRDKYEVWVEKMKALGLILMEA
jgi:isopenicillin N synthase-like dioxygenase